MKICYVNGVNGINSTKPKKLSEILDQNVQHIVLDFEESKDEIKPILYNFNLIKNYDLIIASSFGAFISEYYAYKFNIPLIVLNPVVNVSTVELLLNKKVILDGKFNQKYSNERLVLANKDDELIDFKSIQERFEGNSMFQEFGKGGHRFDNLYLTKKYMLEFINSVDLN